MTKARKQDSWAVNSALFTDFAIDEGREAARSTFTAERAILNFERIIDNKKSDCFVVVRFSANRHLLTGKLISVGAEVRRLATVTEICNFREVDVREEALLDEELERQEHIDLPDIEAQIAMDDAQREEGMGA